ncbi:hypothetical protein MHBO_001954 [Bonamia ostreae]|uniref:Uncharacterized protein n=1 Tax=Bonamia ostreae TaxID=126728 RepID=A0ABV2AKQ3_9EUKA
MIKSEAILSILEKQEKTFSEIFKEIRYLHKNDFNLTKIQQKLITLLSNKELNLIQTFSALYILFLCEQNNSNRPFISNPFLPFLLNYFWERSENYFPEAHFMYNQFLQLQNYEKSTVKEEIEKAFNNENFELDVLAKKQLLMLQKTIFDDNNFAEISSDPIWRAKTTFENFDEKDAAPCFAKLFPEINFDDTNVYF